jgi:hypothetical protein
MIRSTLEQFQRKSLRGEDEEEDRKIRHRRPNCKE